MKWYNWILTIYVFMVYVWTWYLAAMNLLRVRKATPEKINLAVKVFAYPMLIVGLIGDAVLNITIGTVLFYEIPELDRILFTARLSKHAKHSTGYRQKTAKFFCRTFLNSFDPSGCHCDCN